MKRCVIVCTSLLVSYGTILAQVPKGSPPPTYGQTILAHYEARFVRSWQLNVTLIVPSASLQSLLAPGYSVPPGSTASVIVVFALQQRHELPNAIGTLAKGTYGPTSDVVVYADTLNPNGHYEQFNLDNERSTDDSVALVNALWGDGSSRKASSLTIDVKEVTPEEDADADDDGRATGPFVRFSGRVENEAIGLVFAAHAVVPADIATAVRNSLTRAPDGRPEPFRFVNGAARPPMLNAAILQVVNDDRVTLASDGHLKIEVPKGELRLPEGTLPILGVGPTVTVLRTRENFQMKCTGTVCP